MYKKSLKKSKTKIWLAAVASNVILVVFILGCYKKINDGGNPYSMNRSDQSVAISGEDLNKFSSSIKKVDGQAESHYKMALYFQQQKKHKFAIDELKRALHLNPLLAKAYSAMGVSYDKLNRYGQAVRCYQSAIKLDPNLDYVYNNLGYSYLINNELELAIETFQKAIELNGKINLYQNNLALAYILNDQYDEAYEQFKTIENETKAHEKLVSILHKLGKVKIQQYFAKGSNSERNSKELERKKQKIVRKKIDYDTPDSIVKADISEQRLKDQRKEDIKFSIGDKKTLHPNEKMTEDRGSLDETNPDQSHASLTESSEFADPKKLKSLASVKKTVHQEFQIDLDKSGESVPLESNEKETVENDSAPIETTQILMVEYPKPSNLIEILPVTENNNQEKSESLVSSDSVYYLGSAELIPEDKPGKNTTGSIGQEDTYNQNKMKRSAYEYSNSAKVSTEPKIVEVKKAYYQNIKEPNKVLKDSLIETDQKVSAEKSPAVVVAHVPTKTSKDKTPEGKLIQNSPIRSMADMNLADTGKDYKDSPKSEDITVEVEIEVVNGNGVNGEAMKFGGYLKSKGFKVAKVGNANSFNHATTKILYCNGNAKNVKKMLEKIPITLTQRNIIEINSIGNQIKIIIGKDLIKHGNKISKAISGKRNVRHKCSS